MGMLRLLRNQKLSTKTTRLYITCDYSRLVSCDYKIICCFLNNLLFRLGISSLLGESFEPFYPEIQFKQASHDDVFATRLHINFKATRQIVSFANRNNIKDKNLIQRRTKRFPTVTVKHTSSSNIRVKSFAKYVRHIHSTRYKSQQHILFLVSPFWLCHNVPLQRCCLRDVTREGELCHLGLRVPRILTTQRD